MAAKAIGCYSALFKLQLENTGRLSTCYIRLMRFIIDRNW